MAKQKKTKKSDGKGVLGIVTSRVLMLVVAIMLVLAYLSIVINPAKVWVISLVGMLFIPLSAANLFLLL